jgi:hypothetical protein
MNLRATDRRHHAAAALLVMTAAFGVTTACGSGCDASIAAEPVVVLGEGKRIVNLDLSARVSRDGRGLGGVDVVFEIGWPPDGSGGRYIGSARSDADGVAKLHVQNALGPYSATGEHAAEWTKYQVEPSLIQPSDEAAKAVCSGTAEASFRFEP